MDGLRKLTCGHKNTTDEDGTGRAVCVDCGAAVIVRMTREIFDAGMASLTERRP